MRESSIITGGVRIDQFLDKQVTTIFIDFQVGDIAGGDDFGGKHFLLNLLCGFQSDRLLASRVIWAVTQYWRQYIFIKSNS